VELVERGTEPLEFPVALLVLEVADELLVFVEVVVPRGPVVVARGLVAIAAACSAQEGTTGAAGDDGATTGPVGGAASALLAIPALLPLPPAVV
jgi:hypothetical protein